MSPGLPSDPADVHRRRPGDIFELRTAGDIVPPYRPQAACDVAGTLKFAVQAQKISDSRV
ncbi:carbonic anhydrase [Streptomyces sp. LN499]|uniref:carbonic anhydrase n=1 Tax=Streptomyces sp. LN499 TaxID=3112977 RepID=UPI0037227681